MKAMCTALVLLASVAPYVHAQTAPDEQPRGGAVMQAVRIDATIDAIDRDNRIVTLKGPEGHLVAVRVGEDVRNFEQLAPGDTVEMEYIEAVALELKKTERAPTATETTSITRSQPGEKPGGQATRKIRIVTEVMGVNPETQTILVRGPMGRLTRIKVNDPARLAELQAGGRIDITYMEGLVIAVRGKPPQ